MEHLKKRLAKWRSYAGKISCKYNGIGPTGGFCLSPNRKSVGGNDCIDKKFATFLMFLFTNSTVTDFGCGLGQYGKEFQKKGVHWIGYDGAENIESVTNGFVKFLDLTEEHDINKSDWTMSIEVAEHIPKNYEEIYLYNILNPARKGVVLSWALPNQGGHHHVNGKDNKIVICLLETLGFSFDTTKTNALRNTVIGCPWLKNTAMIFSLKNKSWKNSFEDFRTLIKAANCK
jgi:hypothetical protein